MSVLTHATQVRPPSRTLARVLAWPHWFWAVLAIYLAAHVLLRLWETPNIGKNEVQEAVAAQAWAWGYQPRNPPLHTWLLMASYAAFGVSLLAHVVLKYVLLGAAYAFAFLCARRVLSSTTLAAFAALSLTLLAPLAWTVHTASTHTLLMSVLILATLWAAMRLTARRQLIDYAVFGLTIALGLLSKYAFPLFLGPLLIAMVCQRELRRAVLDWRIALTCGVAAVLLAPHAIWMLTARFDFVEFLAEKQRGEVAQPYLTDLAAGLGNVGLGALTFLTPLLFLFPLIFRKAFKAPAKPASPWARALVLVAILGLGLLAVDVLVLRATQFEERYMTCALLVTPLALFAWLDRRAFDARSLRWLGISIAAVMALGFAGLAGRAMFYHNDCNRCWEEMPTSAASSGIRAAGFSNGTIIADHYNVGGNMRVAFPGSRVMAANYYVRQPAFAGTGQCLLVWNARNAGDDVPPALANVMAQRNLTAPPGRPSYVEAPLRRSTERMDRFGYWILPNADANCRPLSASHTLPLANPR
jgi:4-amino-4-deoxy-L-arabinose transferase-like glycosyltransferase